MNNDDLIMQDCYEQSFGERWEDAGSHAQACWSAAWDASRATLVINLPEPYKADVTPQAQAWNRCLDACRSVLFSVGVKTR